MTDTANSVVDSRLLEALEGYFNGVRLDRSIGDCTILTAIRKQNGAPVDIYTPSHAASRDDAVVDAMAKEFQTYEKLGHKRLQAAERLLTSRAFRKAPALALLSCGVPVFDEAFDLHPVDYRLRVLDDILEGLAALHGAGLVHGNLNDGAVRREDGQSGLRLCDFTFCGGRATVVTAQPVAYQTRHVVNNAQPRIEDDIHAAGMLGYRILLGRGGEARVLSGRPDDDDRDHLIAAILGQTTEAPDAAALFPDGHKSGPQIARLLARMTGRLPNAAPFSSAGAAHRAFQSVLTNPQDQQDAPPVDPSPRRDAPAEMERVVIAASGVSRGTAVVLFAGFLASTAAAVWFYMENEKSRDSLAQLRAAATTAVETARSESGTALAEVEAANLRIAELESLVTDTDGALDAANAAGADAAARVTALAALAEERAASLAALTTERDGALAEIAALQAAAQEQGIAIDSATQAGNAALARIAELESIVGDRDTALAALVQDHDGALAQIATLQAMTAERDAMIETARLAAEAAAARITDLEATSSDQGAALLAAEAERTRADAVLTGLQSALAGLRDAERLVHEARLGGAGVATPEAAQAFDLAQMRLDAANAAFAANDPNGAGMAAAEAAGAATAALDAVARARADGRAAEEAASGAATQLLAALAPAGMPGDIAALVDTARQAGAANRLSEAALAWSDAAARMTAQTDSLRAAAETARAAAETARTEAEGTLDAATLIVNRRIQDLHLAEAEAAMAAGAYATAAARFAEAASAIGGARTVDQTGLDLIAPTDFTLGDTAAALEAAVALCRDLAPIPDDQCPAARPASEQERAAQILPFAIDRTEVSAAEFAAFVQETGHVSAASAGAQVVALTGAGEARVLPGSYSWDRPQGANAPDYLAAPDGPVTVLAASDAAAYCAWRNARLPTEAEWEYAARLSLAGAFPWGDATDILTASDGSGPVWRGGPAGRVQPVAVASAGATTPEGLVGLSGNAREWVTADGGGTVLKGGSWNTVNPADLRVAARIEVAGNVPGIDFGFRCANSTEEWQPW